MLEISHVNELHAAALRHMGEANIALIGANEAYEDVRNVLNTSDVEMAQNVLSVARLAALNSKSVLDNSWQTHEHIEDALENAQAGADS